jgi:Mg2+-importing ATPase
MFSISTDNVSEKDLQNPKNYNTKEILVIALLLGIVSTLFDFMIFGIFQRYGEGILQTNWFIGSVATELVLLYSIRTNKVFFKASTPPSKVIIGMTFAALAVAIGLPFTRLGANLFHFVHPSLENLGLLLLIVAAYFGTTEFVKHLYYRYLDKN